MSVSRREDRRRPMPYGPPSPEKPLERRWPTPTPGVPIPRRREHNSTLDQILEKLIDIEKRLGRIEKLLSRRPV